MTATPFTASFTDSDNAHMAAALGLAARGLGRVAPNPAVGCVLVQGSHVVGRGWTQPGGRPHAETEALGRAGGAARGATAFVTLEPCSHHGQTPPCADALIEAGVVRVIAAIEDPDHRVAGQGLARLRAAGITVETGLMADRARALNLGFILNRTSGRPFVTLKLATTLDGKIATATGASQWITGPMARAEGQHLRATHDAVAVGIGTALADNPKLTVRLPGQDQDQPLRVVFDSQGRLPATSALARDGAADSLVLTGPDGPAAIGAAQVQRVDLGADGRIDPAAALACLAARGITRVMVEGGGQLAASLLRAGLVDQIAWFRAGAVMGADGLPGLGPLGIGDLDDMPRFTVQARRMLGGDVLELWVR